MFLSFSAFVYGQAISRNVSDLLDEAFKGNLRIRLHQLQTIDGSPTCLVEIAAWNGWAGQAKLLEAWGGIKLDDAKTLFAILKGNLRGFDWHNEGNPPGRGIERML